MIISPLRSELFDALQATRPDATVDVGLSSGSRIAAWRDMANTYFFPTDISSPAADFEVGKVWVHDVAALRIGVIECDPMTVITLPTHISRHGEEFFQMSIAGSGKVYGSQRGREYEANPGDLTLGTTSDPYVFKQSTRNTRVNMRLPAHTMRERIAGIDDLTCRRFQIEQPLVRIFQDFLASLIREGTGLDTMESEHLQNTLYDLLGLALTSPAAIDSSESSVCLAHRQRILRFVEMNFHKYDLSAAQVAVELELSPRYIQKIFAAVDDTLSDAIRRRRVREAQQLLRRPSLQGRSVEQIAYMVGFADPAYFSRVFRHQTNMAPGEYRRLAERP